MNAGEIRTNEESFLAGGQSEIAVRACLSDDNIGLLRLYESHISLPELQGSPLF